MDIEKLEKLSELKEKGLITQEEFVEQKNKILGIKGTNEKEKLSSSKSTENSFSLFSNQKVWLIISLICLLIAIPFLLTGMGDKGFTEVTGIGILFLISSIMGFIAIGSMKLFSLFSRKFGKEIMVGIGVTIGVICFITNNWEIVEDINTHREQLQQEIQQSQFEDIVNHYMNEFRSAKNEIQESSARISRAQALRGIGSNEVNNWTGRLSKIMTDTKGNATVFINITKNIQIKSSDIGAGSDLYNKIGNMAIGQKVSFSGNFKQLGQDYFYEYSLTIRGSMTAPEYVLNFTDILAID